MPRNKCFFSFHLDPHPGMAATGPLSFICNIYFTTLYLGPPLMQKGHHSNIEVSNKKKDERKKKHYQVTQSTAIWIYTSTKGNKCIEW
jgi:hypothetical protein